MYRQCQHIQWKLLGWLLMSLHAACIDSVDNPGSCKTCFFHIPGFWQESFLHISNHWPTKWPTTHLHISLFDQVNPLIFADIYPGWHNYSFWGFLFQFHSICHAQTSLFVDYAGGSQGVQLLDGSNKGQVWAIRLRQVRGSWQASI